MKTVTKKEYDLTPEDVRKILEEHFHLRVGDTLYFNVDKVEDRDEGSGPPFLPPTYSAVFKGVHITQLIEVSGGGP